jgi:hypothetical protein
MANSSDTRQHLTDELRTLLKSAASNSRLVSRALTSADRQAIRQICASVDHTSQKPEQLLIEFKASLNYAANDAHIPPGPERTELLDQFVSCFIEELYGALAGKETVGDASGGRKTARIPTPSRNPSLADVRP